jgi:hypothetical protein
MAQRTCVQCGGLYAPRRRRQKTCSPRCSSARYRDSHSTLCTVDGCEKPHRARGLCVTHYGQQLPDRHRSKGDPDRRRVTLRTREQHRRAVKRGADAEQINRDQIGERDHWRCGICLVRVDPTLPWPLPLSASLDHVVPLSVGGAHTLANVRITHLTCNVKRSNRGGGEQLALV